MSGISRRHYFWAACAFAASGVALYTTTLSGLTPPDFFVDKKDRQPISFAAAQKEFDGVVNRLIDVSQKELGYKYSETDRERIRSQMWDQAKLVLSEYYVPTEQPSPQ